MRSIPAMNGYSQFALNKLPLSLYATAFDHGNILKTVQDVSNIYRRGRLYLGRNPQAKLL
jgi:hypothetical protein